MKAVLVVSYFFPPFSGGGVVRIHNLVKYLPMFGIAPSVLTVETDYYPSMYRDDKLVEQYSEDVEIVRTCSLEPKQQGFRDKVYGTRERNPVDRIVIGVLRGIVDSCLIPDRYAMWMLPAITRGYRQLKSTKAEAIIATGPPFTSHLVAYVLAVCTRLPLFLDVRDDWIGNVYYDRGRGVRCWIEKNLERRLIVRATKVITVTQESKELFLKKYPKVPADRFLLIPNGFDPEIFGGAVGSRADTSVVHFVHVGSLPPKRTPEFFIRAIRLLFDQCPELSSRIRVTLIGYATMEHVALSKELELEAQIDFVENRSQAEIANVLSREADVCLLFQRNIDGGERAIPGKLYEYLAVRKPILSMTDGGATEAFLRSLGVDLLAAYDDVEAIANMVRSIVENYDEYRSRFNWSDDVLGQFDRVKHARAFAELLQ